MRSILPDPIPLVPLHRSVGAEASPFDGRRPIDVRCGERTQRRRRGVGLDEERGAASKVGMADADRLPASVDEHDARYLRPAFRLRAAQDFFMRAEIARFCSSVIFTGVST